MLLGNTQFFLGGILPWGMGRYENQTRKNTHRSPPQYELARNLARAHQKAEDDGTMRMRIRRSMQKGSTRRYTQFADGLWFGLWFPCGVTSMLQRKSRRK